MEVTPTASTRGPLSLWQLTTQQEVSDMATGSDKDMGGLSSVKVDLVSGSPGKKVFSIKENKVEGIFGADLSPQQQENNESNNSRKEEMPIASHHGRFWGTLSNQVPRGAGLERAGYAAFRNRNRPTLFGAQTWDVSLYPYLALRVRNNVPQPSSSSLSTDIPSLDSESSSERKGRWTAYERARSALGYGVEESVGPKYFVNIQTDGPVTSDLYQHRLWLNPSKQDSWQTVIVPLDAFLLLNSGSLSMAQVSMLKEGIRTVGISCVLESPRLPPSAKELVEKSQQESGISHLRKQQTSSSSAESEKDFLHQDGDPQDEVSVQQSGSARQFGSTISPSVLERGAKRGSTYRFDLAVAGVDAVGSVEEGMELWQQQQ
ncbi:unnamed protein product [Sympodiomycopsis kandeliae]